MRQNAHNEIRRVAKRWKAVVGRGLGGERHIRATGERVGVVDQQGILPNLFLGGT